MQVRLGYQDTYDYTEQFELDALHLMAHAFIPGREINRKNRDFRFCNTPRFTQ